MKREVYYNLSSLEGTTAKSVQISIGADENEQRLQIFSPNSYDTLKMMYSGRSGLKPKGLSFTIVKIGDQRDRDCTNSGFYGMQNDLEEVTPSTIMAIKEIAVMQGEKSARIDVSFYLTAGIDDSESFKYNHRVGQVSFILIDGHQTLSQRIDLPQFLEIEKGGAEIFAAWTPHFEEISPVFLTDANGYKQRARPVFDEVDPAGFPGSFFPVTSSITVSDLTEKDVSQVSTLTVWNDRP